MFSCGNAPFGGGEKPESGSYYLRSLIHVGLQAACGVVTCSGLASIVLGMVAQNPVFHFAFRVQWGGLGFISKEFDGRFPRQIHLWDIGKRPRVR